MDITSIIKTIAPWIGTAIGGPFSGIAVDAACSIFGLSDKTAESLKKAVSGATPEQLKALKDADQTFALKMQELGFAQVKDLEQISMEDRKSARDLLVQIRSWVPAALSILVTVGFFGVLFFLLFGETKGIDQQVLMLMVGSLTTAWATVLAFWFGTTSNSAQKTELIAKAPPVN